MPAEGDETRKKGAIPEPGYCVSIGTMLLK